MQKLTEESNRCSLLRFGNGYSLEETAEAMGRKRMQSKHYNFGFLEACEEDLGGNIMSEQLYDALEAVEAVDEGAPREMYGVGI